MVLQGRYILPRKTDKDDSRISFRISFGTGHGTSETFLSVETKASRQDFGAIWITFHAGQIAF